MSRFKNMFFVVVRVRFSLLDFSVHLVSVSSLWLEIYTIYLYIYTYVYINIYADIWLRTHTHMHMHTDTQCRLSTKNWRPILGASDLEHLSPGGDAVAPASNFEGALSEENTS